MELIRGKRQISASPHMVLLTRFALVLSNGILLNNSPHMILTFFFHHCVSLNSMYFSILFCIPSDISLSTCLSVFFKIYPWLRHCPLLIREVSFLPPPGPLSFTAHMYFQTSALISILMAEARSR